MIGLRSGGPRTSGLVACPVFSTTLRGGPHAPSEARHAIVDHLDDTLHPGALETLKLLFSEAVTNCVKHARVGTEGRIDLAVSRLTSGVRAEVSTAAPAFRASPSPAAGLADEGGRGLQIVDLLSQRWGVGSSSNTLWFEVADDLA
jgi:two-component sensor histidine kinase